MNTTMNTTWTNWILGGALAASVAWNFCESVPTSSDVREGCCATIETSRLRLRDDQKVELEAWMTATCGASCRSDADASAALDQLHQALQEPAKSAEELHALADEVSRLRAQSLSSCVDAILAVRRVLDREQLAVLLETCGSAESCAK